MKNIKILLVLFLSLLVFNLLSDVANAAQEKKIVRVGISTQNFSSRDHQRIKISSQNIIKIIDMIENTQIDDIKAGDIVEFEACNSLFNIYVNDDLKYQDLKGPLLLSSNADLEILDLNRKGTPAKYKGMFELKISKPGYFNIINVVDMENYLKGVVPNEMPISFGKEALKAQAVAARNYATRAQISPDFDVVDSTASQVYYGSNSYRDITNQAVNETKGIYALYMEQPISALYYSTSAGISDDWDDVFNNGIKSDKHPYLKAKYETTAKPLKSENDVIKFYSSKEGFDTNSPKFRWSIEFQREELEKILDTTLFEQSNTGLVEPKYDKSVKIEGLKEIKPLKRTQSGKVTELLITAQNGKYIIKKELGIRRVLKKNNAMLPSANFFVETLDEQVISEDKKNSETEEQKDAAQKENLKGINLFTQINKEKYPEVFKFTGGGFGHGVGMSQFGAYNLAKSGKKYPEILHFYYSNINLSTIPKTVLYNEYNISYKTEFYFDKQTFKKAYIIIDNKKNVSEFPFKINEYDFASTKAIAGNLLLKMDITQYLKQGINTVDFAPLNQQNKGKFIIYRIELI